MTTLEQHARAMSQALVKIRPLGGSELFVEIEGNFYADAKFCGEEIERLRQQLHDKKIAYQQLLNDEHKLSDAYVRLREMIPGALNTHTAPTAEEIWKHTEKCLEMALEVKDIE